MDEDPGTNFGARFMSKRDHKAEYARRKASARTRGISLSQARGHPRPGEAGLRPKRSHDERQVQTIAKAIREHGSLTAAAKTLRIAPERMRRFALEQDLLRKEKGRWRVRHDLPRRVQIYSRGRALTIKVNDFEAASLVGRHMAAVGRFLETPRAAYLEPFNGLSVVDMSGKRHPLETDPNTVHRLAGSTDVSFAQIYRIVF